MKSFIVHKVKDKPVYNVYTNRHINLMSRMSHRFLQEPINHNLCLTTNIYLNSLLH